MVQCPQCQGLVDERTNRVCPKCFASLTPTAPQASPPPIAPQPQMPTLGTPPAVRANARVSLTGEVLEDAPVSRAPANSPYATPPMPRPNMPATPPRATPSAYDRREIEPDNSDKKALFINLTVIFVLLALCGGGGYWKWMHRTEPKAQVTRYVHAIQWLDWGVVWDLSATPPGNKTRHEFLSMMDDKFDSNGVLKIGARRSMENIPFEIGEPTIRGNEATVPVTRGETKMDAARSMQFKLTNFGGVWKIHPLAANPLDVIHDPVTAKTIEEKLRSIQSGAGGVPTFP